MIVDGKPLFLQIAESVEDSIVEGALAEEGRAPSTNELAAFYRINPATAARGIAMLTDKGVLYKRRGIGMFVAPGASTALMKDERERFLATDWPRIQATIQRLGLSTEELLSSQTTGAATPPLPSRTESK